MRQVLQLGSSGTNDTLRCHVSGNHIWEAWFAGEWTRFMGLMNIS